MTFVATLHGRGDRPAVITPHGTVTYRELAELVDRTSRELGAGRRLVLVEAANDMSSLVGYLAALRGGHVAMLAPRSAPEQVCDLIEQWDPDVVVGADGVRQRPAAAGARAGAEGRHELHPDLALLMATSGSTGRPRLVRISADALDANAASIGEYLHIREDDRAVTSLPLHYCYGLSVINSNLRAGAALILDDHSVTSPGFWATVRDHRATSLHGVPHSFELLDRVGFAEMDLPHLRYVTQAGGRMAPEQVQRWATIGAGRGWDLYVMYGQTEATARMAYLPPALARSIENAGTIGVAVPGGTIDIEPVDDAGDLPDGGGEIVYRGPNVMLGYAESPEDLALGSTVDALHTGDLGRRRPDGLVEICGRRNRFVKPFGVRIDLDRLERHLAEQDLVTAATGTDEHLVVAVEAAPAGTARDTAALVRDVIGHRLHLPATAVTVLTVDDLPRRPNGKLDHPAVARLADAAGTDVAPAAEVPRPAAPGPAGARTGLGRAVRRWRRHVRSRDDLTVREIFARTFPGRSLDDDASFVDLGGDSLTYVQVSADIERALGHLPEQWDTMPLGRLSACGSVGGSRRRWATLEAVVLLRAAAIVLVVGEHTHLWTWLGGAHLLLAVSGWTFARFLLGRPSRTDTGDARERRGADASAPSSRGSHGSGGRDPERWTLTRRILRSAALIAIPSSLWIAFRATTQTDVHFADALLMGSVFHPLVQGYWFVGALVQILLIMAAFFALPVARRLDRRYPFGLPVAALGAAQLARLLPERADIFAPDLYSTHLVAWLFVLGWVIQRARTRAQRWATVLMTACLVPSFFGTEIERAAIVGVGLLVLLVVPRVTLPRAVATLASTIATASLNIYLTHFALLPLQYHGVRPALLVPLALAVGVASWWLTTGAIHRGITELRVRRLARSGAPAGAAELAGTDRHPVVAAAGAASSDGR